MGSACGRPASQVAEPKRPSPGSGEHASQCQGQAKVPGPWAMGIHGTQIAPAQTRALYNRQIQAVTPRESRPLERARGELFNGMRATLRDQGEGVQLRATDRGARRPCQTASITTRVKEFSRGARSFLRPVPVPGPVPAPGPVPVVTVPITGTVAGTGPVPGPGPVPVCVCVCVC